MKKRKTNRLPRVTVLALSAKELATFAAAVEQLAQLVADLGQLVPHLRGVGKPRSARPGPARSVTAPAGSAAGPTLPEVP